MASNAECKTCRTIAYQASQYNVGGYCEEHGIVQEVRHSEEQVAALTARVEAAERALGKAVAYAARLCEAIEVMDMKMETLETQEEAGQVFVFSYRVMCGPWHRILGWARNGELQALDSPQEPEPAQGQEDNNG